jgi:Arc/MetJ-type ribon-helix-helix transcriptional regulator
MTKREELKEVLRAHMQKAHNKGTLKEGWIENFIDDIFDGAKERRLKNDPSIQRLSKEMDAALQRMYKQSIKTYGSTDKFPDYLVAWFKEGGYKL